MALSYILSTMWLCTTMIPAMMMRVNPLKLEAPKLDTFTLRVALVTSGLAVCTHHGTGQKCTMYPSKLPSHTDMNHC